MGKEEKLNSGRRWYNYICPSCSYKTEVEEIEVAYFYSQGCKKGV